jgi:hypothetical protein
MSRAVILALALGAFGCGGGGESGKADAARVFDGPAPAVPDVGMPGGLDAPVDAAPADAAALDQRAGGDGADAAPADAGTVELGGAGAEGGAPAADASADLAAAPDTSPDTGPDTAPVLVTLQFTGTVATVAGTPLGLDASARTTAVSGTLAYDLRTPDARPADPRRGRYEHGGASRFTFTVMGRSVDGSGLAIVQTEDLDPDTFRFIDGPQNDGVVRIMKLNGTAAPALELWIAITDGAGGLLASDALPNPFPSMNIGSTPHTFSLKDAGGTLLVQLDSLTVR